MNEFVQQVCRPVHGLKTLTVAFDLRLNIPEFGNVSHIGQLLQEGKAMELPPSGQACAAIYKVHGHRRRPFIPCWIVCQVTTACGVPSRRRLHPPP